MMDQPVIQHREELHYVAIRTRVGMNDIPVVLPPLLSQVSTWMKDKNIVPAGAPFFRYLAMNEQHELDVEVGIPVATEVAPGPEMIAGSFPAGSYAVITHTGHYQRLREVHMQLNDWLKNEGWKEGLQVTPAQQKVGARTEFYINDPTVETNPENWVTEIAMLVEKITN
ncbi:MAG: GyrI-like domain-containing protein [Bacteroidota bacterium]